MKGMRNMTDPIKQAERTALAQKLRSAASGVQREELAINDAERRLKQAEDDLKRAKIGLAAERAALVRHAQTMGLTSTGPKTVEERLVRALMDLFYASHASQAPSYPGPAAPPWGKQ